MVIHLNFRLETMMVKTHTTKNLKTDKRKLHSMQFYPTDQQSKFNKNIRRVV